MFYITTQPQTCHEQEPLATVAKMCLLTPGIAPTNLNGRLVDLCEAMFPPHCYKPRYFIPTINDLYSELGI